MEKNQRKNRWNFDRRTILKSAAASSLAGGLPAAASTAQEDRPRGYTGRYFNLPESHPDMEDRITGRVTGMVAPELPLRFTGAGGVSQPDWFDESRLSFERIDPSLSFGGNFFPLDEGLEGDPFHFAVHWSARVVVPENGTYTFSIASDDDSWVFVDRQLTVDNGGVHAAATRSGSIFLEEGEYDLDIYYAERHRLQSAMTFTPDSRVEVFATEGNEFDRVKREKLALAGRLTAMSPTIDEAGRVEASLSAMEALVDDDELEADRAVEAVERMKLGENVTEALLAGIGPSVAAPPEGADTLIGAPAGSPPANPAIDIAGRTVELAFDLLVAVAAVAKLVAEAAGALGRLGSVVGSARRRLESVESDLLDEMLSEIDEVAEELREVTDEVGQEVIDLVVDSGITAGEELAAFVASELTDIRDTLANEIVGHFEQNRGAESIDAHLAGLDASLGGGGTGQPSFGGSLAGAESASETGVALINAEVAEGDQRFDILDTALDVATGLELVGVALLAVSGGTAGISGAIGAVLEAIGFITGVASSFLGAANGPIVISRAAAAHGSALDGVVEG